MTTGRPLLDGSSVVRPSMPRGRSGGCSSATGRERRGGAVGVLVLSLLLLVVGGIATFPALCPSPCGTAWPLMEATNWLGIAVGVVAVASAGGRLAAAT
jgi:hypothetical protein